MIPVDRRDEIPAEKPVDPAVAVDAFVFIESVRVVGRHRRDLGDVTSLARSIDQLGLLHPITLTRDSRLVAGQRRLEACRQLGWVQVPARFIDSVDDAATLLLAERDENTEHKEMLPSELASLGEALYEIEEKHAKARQRLHGGTAPGRSANTCADGGTSVFQRNHPPGSEQNKTRAVIGKALGMSSSTYGELRYVYRTANNPDQPDDIRAFAAAALADMDRTGHIAPNADRVRAKVRAQEEAEQAEAEQAALAAAQEKAEPEGADRRSYVSQEQRLARITEMALRGYTSAQIAGELGVSAQWVRQLAREGGIAIQADAALGRSRKSIDSNRIVRETAATLDGLVMGVGLVDIDALDRAEIDGWVRSLSASMRALNGLVKQMKETTR